MVNARVKSLMGWRLKRSDNSFTAGCANKASTFLLLARLGGAGAGLGGACFGAGAGGGGTLFSIGAGFGGGGGAGSGVALGAGATGAGFGLRKEGFGLGVLGAEATRDIVTSPKV